MNKIRDILDMDPQNFQFLQLSVAAFFVLFAFFAGVTFSRTVSRVVSGKERRKRKWTVIVK